MFLDAVTEAFENLQTSVDNLGNGIISKSLFTLHQFLRIIIGFIDGLIYTIDAEIYDLMLKIADYSVFEAETINEISGRVYQLLALIMMFRLIFVFINYVVNPDQIVDKKKGLGNIAKKIIITLILIIVTPWAFSESRKVQKIIFEDKAIEYFVFGQTMDENVTNGYSLMHGIGKMFVSPYKCYKADDGWNCTPDKTIKKEICSNTWDTDGSLTVENGQYSATGGDDVCGYGASQDKEFAKALSNSTTITAHKYDLMSFMQLAKYGNEDGRGWDSDFYVEYKYPLIGTTLIGIIIGYILVSMCIDIALRSVKLAFYEIISPIPIISNIGLKEGKDSMLGKWFNDVLKTYLDLFIRIIGLELAMLFINTLMEKGFNEVTSTGDFSEFFVKLFLVLGALIFAKKIPDILKNLGINLDTGGFSIKKKLEPATSVLRPLTGAAAGAIGGATSNIIASKNVGRNLFTSGASAVGGALTGAFRGATAGAKQKNGLAIGAGFGAAGKSGQKIYNKVGTTSERYFDRARSTMGMRTQAEVFDDEIKVMDTYAGFKKQMKDNADFYKGSLDVSLISGGKVKSYTTSPNATIINGILKSGGVKDIKQYYEDLQRSGNASQTEISAAREAYEDAQQFVIGNNLSTQVNYIKDQAARYVKANRRILTSQTVSATASWQDLNSGFIDASNEATRVRSSEEYAKAQYNKNWAQSGKSKK